MDNNDGNNSEWTRTKALGLTLGLGAGLYVLSKMFHKPQEEDAAVRQEEQREIPQAQAHRTRNCYAKNKTTLQVLENLCRILKLDENAITMQNEILKNIILEVVEWLKSEDQLFCKLFQEIAWTGSFYEGLKIEKPDEFDLNLVLRFPFKTDELDITTKRAVPGNVCISKFRELLHKMKAANHPHWDIYKKMESWCDSNGALKQTHIRIWLEGLLDKYIHKNGAEFKRKYALNHLRHRKSGPALTLELNKFSIDLVPAFECKAMVPPPPFKKIPVNLKNLPWYLIPKPVVDKDAVWRLSFFRHEQELIRSKECLKPAIRLIKKLRDTMQWKSLHSYFIKTAVLWEIHEKNVNNNMKLDQLFFHLLKRLQTRLEKDDLPFFWDPRYSMLCKMDTAERINIANSLKRLIRKFEIANINNPALIGEIIAPFAVEE